LILSEIEPPQTVNSRVAHRFFDITFDDRGDGAPRPLMHPVAQFEIPHRKFGWIDMLKKGIALRFVEPVILN
jgi:hypothetical protein